MNKIWKFLKWFFITLGGFIALFLGGAAYVALTDKKGRGQIKEIVTERKDIRKQTAAKRKAIRTDLKESLHELKKIDDPDRLADLANDMLTEFRRSNGKS
jgi:hypothetical protein